LKSDFCFKTGAIVQEVPDTSSDLRLNHQTKRTPAQATGVLMILYERLNSGLTYLLENIPDLLNAVLAAFR
jgi:hypothetical protein